MDYINYVFIALFILFIVYRFMPTKGVRNISIAELKNELKDKNKLFVDVRTPGEFKGNHIRQFKNIPLIYLHKKQKKNFQRTKKSLLFVKAE